jgi:hypothetical protein
VGARFIEQPMPPPPTGRAAADEAIARGRGDLAGGERGVVTAPAPRPRGLSISGRPSQGPSAQPAQASPPPAGPAAPPAPPAPASKPDEPGKPDGKQDDAAIRFSLLELD